MNSTTSTRRASVPAAAAACAAAAALLLSGCGSSGKQAVAAPTGITGAQTASATPSASPTPTPAADAPPAAVLPAGFTIVVDGGSTGNAEKDAVLAANLSFYRAMYQAIGRHNANDSLYQQWTGQATAMFNARSSTQTYIQKFVTRGVGVTGTLRIYDEVVSAITGKQAQLHWCEDQTLTYAKNISTGKVDYTKPSRNDFTYYQSIQTQNSSGRWITTAIQGIQGDSRCS